MWNIWWGGASFLKCCPAQRIFCLGQELNKWGCCWHSTQKHLSTHSLQCTQSPRLTIRLPVWLGMNNLYIMVFFHYFVSASTQLAFFFFREIMENGNYIGWLLFCGSCILMFYQFVYSFSVSQWYTHQRTTHTAVTHTHTHVHMKVFNSPHSHHFGDKLSCCSMPHDTSAW